MSCVISICARCLLVHCVCCCCCCLLLLVPSVSPMMHNSMTAKLGASISSSAASSSSRLLPIPPSKPPVGIGQRSGVKFAQGPPRSSVHYSHKWDSSSSLLNVVPLLRAGSLPSGGSRAVVKASRGGDNDVHGDDVHENDVHENGFNYTTRSSNVLFRMATPLDAFKIHELFKKMAENLQDKFPEEWSEYLPPGKEVNLVEALKSGRVHALVAERPWPMPQRIVGYALFYYGASSRQDAEGEVVHLVEFYLDPKPEYQQIRQETEDGLLRGLANIAKSRNAASVVWAVSGHENPDIVKLCNQLTGARELTTTKNWSKREIYWRLHNDKFEKILGERKEDDAIPEYVVKLQEVNDDEDEANAEMLLWVFLSGRREGVKKVAKLLREGNLRALTVNGVGPGGKVLGLALFNTNTFSMWSEQYLWVDSVAIEPRQKGDALRKLITKIMVHLIAEARGIGATRIEGTTNGRYESELDVLGAINMNMAQNDQWLLYEWDYEQYLRGEQNKEEAKPKK